MQREKEEEKRGGSRKKQDKRGQHLQEEVEETHRGEEQESDSSSTRSRGESRMCAEVEVSEEEDFGSDHRGEYRDRISSVDFTSNSEIVDDKTSNMSKQKEDVLTNTLTLLQQLMNADTPTATDETAAGGQAVR